MKKRKTLALWFKRSGAVRWSRRHRFTEKQFQPYVKAIGQLLLAWNDLHERLSALFVMSMGGGWVDRPLAIWHSVRNDYGKRNLLRSAILKLEDGQKAERPHLVSEILWILDSANELEGFRDDSVHTPLHFSFEDIYAVRDLYELTDMTKLSSKRVYTDTVFQNPRAVRLDQKNKDLLIEYRYARERTLVLRDYAIALDYAWSGARIPWPGRPSLPERKPRRAARSRAAGRGQK
jgi:hypothetical protein